MSMSVIASPIIKLHTDILLQIFHINTDMDQDCSRSLAENERIMQKTPPSIHNTRNSSQVNSLWRNLILDAPTLWANLIDIEYLDHSGDWWRQEVIRRARDCVLHVKGTITVDSPDDLADLAPRWLTFLDDNWARIRKLDIAIRTGDRNFLFPFTDALIRAEAARLRKALPFLSRTPCALESFYLCLPYRCGLFEPGSLLFDGYAPQITHFGVKRLRFSPQNSWLQQLRSLHIDDSQTFRSGDEICQVLSQMPYLEYLTLGDAIADKNIRTHRKSIALPRLQYLAIKDSPWDQRDNPSIPISTIWPLLDRIISPPGCSAKLQLSQSYTGHIDIPVFSQLATNYFQVHPAKTLDIIYGEHRYKFGNSCSSERMAETPVFDLGVFVKSNTELESDEAVYQGFKALFGLSFPQVTALRLEIRASICSPLSCPQLYELLTTFTSVETLAITAPTLDFLSGSPVIDLSILFPRLKVLKVAAGGFRPYYDRGPVSPATLTQLLSLRKEAGFPVLTLEYESVFAFHVMDNLTFLDDISRLKVVWKTKTIGNGEYICGSGNPEELDFVKKSEMTVNKRLA